MSNKTLKDLLIHALRDVYFAESAIHKALPKIIDASKRPGLKDALTKHRHETEDHISRLEQAFGAVGMKPQSTPCEAIKGILKEGDEIIEAFGESEIGDAAIVFACQAVEHYEINRYGTMHAWAAQLGMDDVASLLADTLQQEHAANDALTSLAEEGINEAGGSHEADADAKNEGARGSDASAPS